MIQSHKKYIRNTIPLIIAVLFHIVWGKYTGMAGATLKI